MSRTPSVWRNAGKGNAWYTTYRGQKKKIADADCSEQEAIDAWHQYNARDHAAELSHCNAVGTILDLYLDYLQGKSTKAYRDARTLLKTLGEWYRRMRVADFKAAHVRAWLADRSTWSDTTKATALAKLQAAFNWAANPDQGILDSNRLRGMKAPRQRSRGKEALIPPDDDEVIRRHAPRALADALLFIRATGTRPVNLGRISRQTVYLDQRVVVLEQHKTADKTGKPLLIPLPESVVPLLQGLMAQYPTGPLFRKRRGSAWTGRDLSTYFCALKKRLRRQGIKLAATTILYGYRHTLATNLLLGGLTGDQVGAILGQEGSQMVAHHYGHLLGHAKTLAGKMNAVIGPDDGSSDSAAARRA